MPRKGERSRFGGVSDLQEEEGLSQSSSAPDSASQQDLEQNQLIGSVQGSIVGLRYYTGTVNKGEMVSLVREPQNQFDRNAVRVKNVGGVQVGHIKKELAAALSLVMDRGLARIEGVVPYGMTNKYTMPVNLAFWGPEENRAAVHSQMRSHGYKLGGSVKGSSGASRDRSAGQSSEICAVQLTQEELKNAFDRLFDELSENRTQEMEAVEAVRTPLLPHQKKALFWMASRENSSDLPPFWEQRSGLYLNVLTNFAVRERPDSIHGGILADDMGLGKTLTTIALILSNFHNGEALPLEYSEGGSSGSRPSASSSARSQKGASGSKAEPQKPTRPSSLKRPHEESSRAAAAADQRAPPSSKGAAKKKPRPTLIVCPLSVLSNWMGQFEQHLRDDVHLNLHLYHGADRSRQTSFLSKQDVVLTTYNVLSSECGNSVLHKVVWLRVVLDEGHIIRNPDTLQSKAVLELNTQRRWILSGTPIQNSVKDMWMLVSFLRLKPFVEKEWWMRIIERPVMTGDPDGLKNLQALVKVLTLRRTKSSRLNGHVLIQLPKKTVFLQKVELSEEERAEYEREKAEGRSIISRYVEDGTVLTYHAYVLAILMRLRQLCCHRDLVGKPFGTAGAADASSPAELREHLISKIRLVLSSGSDEECAVCLDSLRQPVITHCAHVFCKPCICEVIRSEQDRARCPLCRANVKASELLECPTEELETGPSNGKDRWRSSSKVEALMRILLKLRSEDPTIKSLVVSQFTKFLNVLEEPLREYGFTFTRLDGSMTQKARARAVSELQDPSPGSPTVMLLSLKAGGVGINLTGASRVFLMEPAWNPAAEDQCVDRCHRLGQTRDVIITKFVVKDSVEETMVKIQRRKQDLVQKVFGVKSAEERKQERIKEIRSLMDI